MADDEDWAPKTWQRYHKHRKATIRQWESSEAAAWTANNRGEAQYDPNRYGWGERLDAAVKEIEELCLDRGIEIKTVSENKRKFYLQFGDIVGACRGEQTPYLYVEWLKTGLYHGRPISPKALHIYHGVEL